MDSLLEDLEKSRLSRRHFLAGSLLLPTVGAAAAPYRVGLGRSSDPYAATVRAVDACGDWNSLNVSGKIVVIKPNLVLNLPATSGVTTDPEVVRAVVDRALRDGAASVLIIESGPNGANFAGTGYNFFQTYDPQGRVHLVDLSTLTSQLQSIRGWIYRAVYAPQFVVRRDIVFINIAKLKTHTEALATLTVKNVFGIPDVTRYVSTPSAGRFAFHDRGVNQSIIDLNILRPTDFAIIDGVWGMEGFGPLSGIPVRMDTLVAGRNAVAVDRVGLALMEIPQLAVRHLNYASTFLMGPRDLSQIDVLGDALVSKRFSLPLTPPNFDPPIVSPAVFRPGAGESCTAMVQYRSQCYRTADVLKLSDEQPTVEVVRALQPQAFRSPGTEVLTWDGRADSGNLAPPGRYAIHIRANEPNFVVRHGDAMEWVSVL